MALKMGTQKLIILLGLVGYRVIAQYNSSGRMGLELHKPHSFSKDDTIYLSLIRISGVKNSEFTGYNGKFKIYKVDDSTHIVFDLTYNSELVVDEGMLSADYYIYDSLIYSEYMAHEYDQVFLAIDPDMIEIVRVSTGFTPGSCQFIITMEDAISRYNSIRATRLALEEKLYTLLNYLCVSVGAMVSDNFEYLEGVSPDGEIAVKVASAIEY